MDAFKKKRPRPVIFSGFWFCFFMQMALFPGCTRPEAEFIAGADYDVCLANIPICRGTAGCTLTEYKYLEGDFPGFRNFIVTSPADTKIKIKIFFKTREHPGQDTTITWYEPGCTDSHKYESNGADLFLKAGGDRIFAVEEKMRRSGDHLVEIDSDAHTHYFLRIELITPN
ncbi:MAG: hypothetical protein GXP49_12150 [Deltaproteobacteria bacterium]|nr:hypothetical protein [Deltaproteobacteria bacterium]